MRQRGRMSANHIAMATDGKPSWLKPSSRLTKSERALFVELVASCPPDQFVKSDRFLLESFVQATAMVRNAARSPKKIAMWEKAVRTQTMLASRLRLSPSSRTDPRTLARKRNGAYGGGMSAYDLMRLQDGQ